MSALISVILPTYNRAYIVKRAIQSVLNQTFKDFELIVIDDGSSDDTESVIGEFGSSVKYIKQANQGVSAARNTGIRHSQGQYIAFIDSDDEWMETKLEDQLNFFRQHPEENYGLVFSDCIWQTTTGKTSSRPFSREDKLKSTRLFPDMLAYHYLGPSSVMVRADVIDKNAAFDESLKTAEDVELFLRISQYHPAGYIDKKLSKIHETVGSLGDSFISYEDNISVLERFKDFCYSSGLKSEFNQAMYKVHLGYAITLLWKGKMAKSRQHIWAALKYKRTFTALKLLIKSYIKSAVK